MHQSLNCLRKEEDIFAVTAPGNLVFICEKNYVFNTLNEHLRFKSSALFSQSQS